jgi:hypothetical protein
VAFSHGGGVSKASAGTSRIAYMCARLRYGAYIILTVSRSFVISFDALHSLLDVVKLIAMNSIYTYILLLTIVLQFQPCTKCTEAKCISSRKPFAIPLVNCTPPGTNVDSWGISSIEISGTNVCLTPSMFVDNVLLMDKILCQDGNRNEREDTVAQCESRRGGPVSVSALSSFANGTDSDLAPDRNWINLMARTNITKDVYGTIGRVDLGLPNDVRLSQFAVGVVNQGQNHNAAHLGLGLNSTFLNALGASGMGPALGFGLDVGSQSVAAPRFGNLVVDGYDSSSIGGAWHNYTINSNTPNSDDRICPLQVQVKEMTVKFANGTHSDTLLGSGLDRGNYVACIEP